MQLTNHYVDSFKKTQNKGVFPLLVVYATGCAICGVSFLLGCLEGFWMACFGGAIGLCFLTMVYRIGEAVFLIRDYLGYKAECEFLDRQDVNSQTRSGRGEVQNDGTRCG